MRQRRPPPPEYSSPDDAPPRSLRTGFGGSLLNAVAALENRDFRILWMGVGLHAMTLWMEIVARNWLVWEMTGDLIAVGWINFWRTIPVLFLAIPAGVIADRYNRKVILIVTQFFILAVYAVLVVLLLLGTLELWHTYALFAFRGAAIAFNQPARQALIPMVVRSNQVGNAVSLQQLLFNGTRIVAPILTGFLFGVAGAVVAFGIIVILEFVIIGAWFALRSQPSQRDASYQAKTPSAMADTIEGIRYVMHHRTILVLLLLGLLSLVFLQPFMVILPQMADTRFEIGPEGFGAFITMMGVGSVFGPLTLAFLGDVKMKGALVVGSMALSGIVLAVLGASPWLVMAMGAVIVLGFFDSSQRVITNGLLLTQTDREFHGRVISLYLLDRGFVPIGSLVAGYLASSAGETVALGILGGCLTVSVLLLAAFQPRFLSAK